MFLIYYFSPVSPDSDKLFFFSKHSCAIFKDSFYLKHTAKLFFQPGAYATRCNIINYLIFLMYVYFAVSANKNFEFLFTLVSCSYQ